MDATLHKVSCKKKILLISTYRGIIFAHLDIYIYSRSLGGSKVMEGKPRKRVALKHPGTLVSPSIPFEPLELYE